MSVEDVQRPFWRTKTLEEMSRAEWESLCDGCGRCCLIKLIDEDTDEVHFTRLACKLLDSGSCRCTDYENRKKKVPDCVKIDARKVRKLKWLPKTCAYRLLAEGKDLAWWHPLVSGDSETVHQAGISVRGAVISEELVPLDTLDEYLIDWIET